MLQDILESIISWLIVIPLLFLSYDKKRDNRKAIIMSFAYYVIYSLVLVLPIYIDILRFVDMQYNWSGKIYATLFSLVIYWLFRREFSNQDYITIKQKPGSLKLTVFLIFAPLVIIFLINIFISSGSVFRLEDLFFQLSLPGIDEEIAYRGLLLGLLGSSLKRNIKIGHINLGHSGVLITSIIFGITHGIKIDDDWNVSINYTPMLFTGSMGYLFGFITIHSRSIFCAIISHNFVNTFGYLVRVFF